MFLAEGGSVHIFVYIVVFIHVVYMCCIIFLTH